jgi:hypothetical protein
VRNAGATASVEDSTADWHANDTAARISDVDQATAAFNQPARSPCDENGRDQPNVNPVKLHFQIPARPAYSWIAHMTVAHCHLKQVGVQLELLEYLLRTLPKSKQSEHRQERGNGQQYRRKSMIIGTGTEPVMHTEATMRPRNQKHGDLPPTPEWNKPKISSEHYVIAAIHVERGIYVTSREEVVE